MAKWTIVGAGLAGASVAERIASRRGEEVLVVERREHVAGTASDFRNDDGILVQRFGPHVFHTSSEAIWTYVQRFANWRETSYRVSAKVEGKLVSLPVGFRGIEQLMGEKAEGVKRALLERFGAGARVPILTMRREKDAGIRELAERVYEGIIRGYTVKHWGVRPEELSPSVTARVPVVVGNQESYHASRHQAVPEGGYTQMVANMLDHPLIKVELGTEYSAGSHKGSRVVWTGPMDEYFDHALGRLPYRSVRFVTSTEDRGRALPVATVNYPNEQLFTRVTEMKQITGQDHPKTVLMYEFPTPHTGRNEPLYPVPDEKSREMFRRYSELRSDAAFCGRLGEYAYYNMDQAIASAVALEKRL